MLTYSNSRIPDFIASFYQLSQGRWNKSLVQYSSLLSNLKKLCHMFRGLLVVLFVYFSLIIIGFIRHSKETLKNFDF